ncbi:MAG TPA: sterol desaturase family protein [Rudaea sp.]|nr:sterol desaturase family protein [Rudaea sp.]
MSEPLQQAHWLMLLRQAAGIVLFGGFVVAFAAEFAFPRRRGAGPLGRLAHARSNLLLWLAGIAVMSAVYGGSVMLLLNWLQLRGVGLLTMLALPAAVKGVLAFLALDIGDYLFHRLSHRVRWLWLLHAVHHSDAHVDVTTNLRQHPLHIVLAQFAKILVCAAFGVPVAVFLLHEVINIGVAHSHHAAVAWPRSIDRVFAWLLITPRMHWNHHSPEMARTNSNFGVIFSVWDRAFGTLTQPVADADPPTGLHALGEARWHSAWGMLATPWRARRLPQL